MTPHEIRDNVFAQLKAKKIPQAEFGLFFTTKHELNLNNGQITLLRTTQNSRFSLSVINQKQQNGVANINKIDPQSLTQSVSSAIDIAKASPKDAAHAIAPYQNPQTFHKGLEAPDLEKMYTRFHTFQTQVKKQYPKIVLEDTILSFTQSTRFYQNTNGVDFKEYLGSYLFNTCFTAKDGKHTSSFNGTAFNTLDLDQELLDYATISSLFSQITEQTHLKSVPTHFVGDLIITPDCLIDFIEYFISIYLSESALISGTSILKDSLQKLVASPLFSLHSQPLSSDMATNYFMTGDGFAAQNSTIIDQGVLRGFLLGLYGARKIGQARAVNDGDNYVVDPGQHSYKELIKNTRQGILLCRFSGGDPSSSGDFSGVAKNSYYIKNGKIQYPVNETMIAGNILEMFKNILAVSQERINFGDAILPWIAFSGISVSGK